MGYRERALREELLGAGHKPHEIISFSLSGSWDGTFVEQAPPARTGSYPTNSFQGEPGSTFSRSSLKPGEVYMNDSYCNRYKVVKNAFFGGSPDEFARTGFVAIKVEDGVSTTSEVMSRYSHDFRSQLESHGLVVDNVEIDLIKIEDSSILVEVNYRSNSKMKPHVVESASFQTSIVV